jgi:lysyl endopeptidase
VLSGTTLRAGAGLSCTNLNENATYGRFEIFYPQIEPYLSARSYAADDLPNQPTDAAPALTLDGPAVSASIGRAGDLDVFRVDVPTAGTLTVGSKGGNDLIAALLDANGAPVEPTADSSSDDAEQGNNEFGITVRVAPGRYYLSVGHFVPGATTPSGYQVFAKFTTATENYTNMWWIESESGWGFNVNHQDNTIFGTLYTYDTNNRATWLALSNGALQPDGSYSGDLYRVRGPAFNAVPFSGITPLRVGNMRVSFSGAAGSAQTATITYDISGVPITKTMKRLEFATPFPVCKFSGFDRSAASNYTDIWWNPNESGWGLTLAHQGDVLSGTLYTYDRTGQDIWLSMSRGDRRLTSNSVVFEGALYRATGNAFNRPPYTLISATQVGTMKVEFPFNNSNAAKLTYDFDGSTVVKDIQRTVFGNARTVCGRQ